MKFIYKPEGAEPREWPFAPNKFMNAEAEEIERRTGMDFGEWSEAVLRTNVRAIRGLLYILLKRETPTLKWDQVAFAMDEVEIELELSDKKRLRDEILAGISQGRLDEDEARPALEAITNEIAEEEGPQVVADEAEAPKDDLERTFAESGSGPSQSI